jgi:methylglyoxal synthase
MPATIALIAHDSRKDDLIALLRDRSPVFSRYHLIATGGTGHRVQDTLGLPIEILKPGAIGGDAQVAAEITAGHVSAVIFLEDTLYAQRHEPGIDLIARICNIHNIPFATNVATAEAIIQALARTQVAHLVFNPVSGQGNSEQELQLIHDLLEPAMQLVVHETTVELSAEKLAQEAIDAKADLVLASGGDGTVSAVAGKLIGTNIPLGIIPRGTANAFASALGIPTALNPIRGACQTILTGHRRVVDAAFCNGLPMILLAGIGLEAETVDRADRAAKDRWGALAYLMAGWQQLDEQQLFDTEIEVDGHVECFQAGAITIANAAPITSVLAQGIGQVVFDDGLLDVTIASAKTKLEAIRTIARLIGSALLKPSESPDIVHMGAKKLRVTTNPPQKVVLDGEIIGTTPVEINCVPGGLTVMAP